MWKSIFRFVEQLATGAPKNLPKLRLIPPLLSCRQNKTACISMDDVLSGEFENIAKWEHQHLSGQIFMG